MSGIPALIREPNVTARITSAITMPIPSVEPLLSGAAASPPKYVFRPADRAGVNALLSAERWALLTEPLGRRNETDARAICPSRAIPPTVYGSVTETTPGPRLAARTEPSIAARVGRLFRERPAGASSTTEPDPPLSGRLNPCQEIGRVL